MEISKIIAEELAIKEEQVNAVITLIDEGNTIPFIARYRKEVHGSLDDETLRKLDTRLQYLRNMEERMQTILKSIEEQGLLTDEIKTSVLNAKTMTELEDIYRPFKPKKKTKAGIAKEKGLQPLADYILAQKEDKPLMEYAATFISEEKKVASAQEAIEGALDIISDAISDEVKYRNFARKIFKQFGKVITKENIRDAKGIFDMYKDYSEGLANIANHRILAINRGEKLKALKVTYELPDDEIINYIKKHVIKLNSPFESLLCDAIDDSYKRLILPSVETEICNELTERAEDASILVFKANLHQLLLVAPIKNKVVLGFDPGYAHGCKIAVVDAYGKVLDTNVVYPTPPRNQIDRAKEIVSALIKKHNVNLIAIGNGTASRESQSFIASLIEELPEPYKSECKFTVVSEAGASVYSATKLAAKEFPDYDVNLRSAVSIARRIQDPLAELVKIPPEAIGVGQYQHDMNQKKLNTVLGGVVEDCVNMVGVDVNSASPSLLEYVSGITSTIAENIVKYREDKGPFKTRSDLLNVNKLGPKAYEQCAGFLRITNGDALENTGVHPESYDATIKLLKELGLTTKDLNTEKCVSLLNGIENTSELAKKLGIGEPTLVDIIEELKKPGRDPRDEAQSASLRQDVLEIKDLKEGMILEGTVRNIMDFGVFVDIGVHHDGFIHISKLSNKFVKHPLDIVKLNDIVKVKVIGVDVEKERISLSLKDVE